MDIFRRTIQMAVNYFLWNILKPCLFYMGNLWPFSLLKQRMVMNLGKPGNTRLERYMMTKLLESANEHDELLAVERADIQSSDKVLEIGFGPGLGLQHAASLVSKSEGGHVTGVDYSASMVEVASNRLMREIKDGIVDILCGSVAKLPCKDETFDKIFHCNVFYFWDDCVGCCRELLRVLKPRGLMVTTVELDGVASAVSMGLLKKDNANVNTYMVALKEAGFVGVEMNEHHVAGKLYGCIVARANSFTD